LQINSDMTRKHKPWSTNTRPCPVDQCFNC